VLQLAAILPDKPLTVITNSLQAALSLTEKSHITVYLLRRAHGPVIPSCTGWAAMQGLELNRIDMAFISCRGLDPALGLSDATEEQAELKRQVVLRASEVVLLADHTRSRLVLEFFFAKNADVDFWITDSPRKMMCATLWSRKVCAWRWQNERRPKTHLAVDLGASGGRVMAGHFDGSRLEIEEGARFPNSGLQAADGWHWDAEGLFKEITAGLASAAARFGGDIVSVAVDTWGVDYASIGADGRAINEPWMYRDSRTDGLIAEAARLAGEDKVWSRTGIQPLFFNTIYQLMAEARLAPQALDQAPSLLFIPDYLNYRLCGVQAIERTIASTSGLLQAGTDAWDLELAETLGIPARILGKITEPGVILGEITDALAAATGLRGVKVATCGSHDTASAVAGVPSPWETAFPQLWHLVAARHGIARARPDSPSL
jgi:hypothetical protein